MALRAPVASFAALALLACAGAPPRELPPKELPLPGERLWLGEHAAFVIPATTPRANGAPQPWVLYAPTLPPYPDSNERWLFEQLTAAGVAIAGIDVGESYGNAAGIAGFAALCEHLAARGWSRTPVLLARSRGGLQQLAFAIAQPQRVAAIAGIYPVCDLASYPGIAKAAQAYGFDQERFAAELDLHNPIDWLAPIAAAHVPMFAIHGDQDRVVPIEANTGALAERYRALGGAIEVELATGHGHDLWPGFFRSPRLLSFLLTHAR